MGGGGNSGRNRRRRTGGFWDNHTADNYMLYHRVHTDWQSPPLSGVQAIKMEKLAQPCEGGGCAPTPFYYIYHHVQRSCGVRFSWEGRETDLFENYSENSLKGDLSNDTTVNPPLFSLVNTFKRLRRRRNLYSSSSVFPSWMYCMYNVHHLRASIEYISPPRTADN